MTSEHKLKASSEGSKCRIWGDLRLEGELGRLHLQRGLLLGRRLDEGDRFSRLVLIVLGFMGKDEGDTFRGWYSFRF